MCSKTNKKLWSTQFLYDFYHIAKHISVHIVLSTLFVFNQKFKKNLNLAKILQGDSKAPPLYEEWHRHRVYLNLSIFFSSKIWISLRWFQPMIFFHTIGQPTFWPVLWEQKGSKLDCLPLILQTKLLQYHLVYYHSLTLL